MDTLKDFLETIDQPAHQEKFESLMNWIKETYPSLELVIKWNQPIFTDHGTFIIGFSKAKNHFSISIEDAGMAKFDARIKEVGYEQTMRLFKIKWNEEIDFKLLGDMIEYNIMDKADLDRFWR